MSDAIETGVIHTADALERLEDLPENSVHAVVTDPPYGLAFMGRDWDSFEPREYQAWCERWASKCLDVLRPGGHLLAFSGNRTHHRLFSGVEDAGFEVRDTLTYHYGSGFPKALDVSKAIDKAADAEREVVGHYEHPEGGQRKADPGNGMPADGHGKLDEWHTPIEAPATDAAERWDGFKTALKPATEFVVLARAPLAEGTVAENVQAWGTGALNIDGCRIESDGRKKIESHAKESVNDYGDGLNGSESAGTTTEGRYPANVVFDEQAAADLDREVGETADSTGAAGYGFTGDVYDAESIAGNSDAEGYDDSGGPSRYFYTSKATRAERTLDGQIDNSHPTVKPADLMEWLVRLATREGQVVPDPFAGTGTTLRAAKDLGREFVGIEKQAQWADVARARAGLTPEDPDRLTDDEQATLAGVNE